SDGVPDELLALACASHDGEPFHLDGVRAILASAGLGVDALQNTPDMPLDAASAFAWELAGHGPESITQNCSGKHAAMLAACALNGWDRAGYLDPAHPLQQLVHRGVEAAAGEPVTAVGTDGCGAPLMAISLVGLARAFRTFVLAEPGTPERRVGDAMRAHPEYVAGTRRADTWLMRAVPGALSKMGAEAVQVVALADGRALAFKIEDGAERARGPVLAAALRRLGVQDPVLERIAAAPLHGGGNVVGEVRAAF
ncbi:MAG: asparaginase, partial [Kitasatospora sp.]|nr:asparaginase [Kitasatospora sp.]